MSKTVRYKLYAAEEKYILQTINMLRRSGVHIPSIDELGKTSLMEFCAGINQRVNRELARLQAEAEAGGESTSAIPEVGETEGTDGDTSTEERADVSNSEEEESEGSPTPEAGGNDVDRRDGGE